MFGRNCMIDLEIYDVLEKIVDLQKDALTEYKKIFLIEGQRSNVEINAIQSLIRQVVVEKETDFNPVYSRLKHGEDGYETEKLSNLEFDMDFLLTLLSNVPGLMEGEILSIISVVLCVLMEIRKCKVKLAPSMSVIVFYLYNHECQRQLGKTISEEKLKMEVKELFEKYENIDNFENVINGLVNLKVISLDDGEIQLIEKVA